jgi:hypothetical protein
MPVRQNGALHGRINHGFILNGAIPRKKAAIPR